jgi:hypothetical protein
MNAPLIVEEGVIEVKDTWIHKADPKRKLKVKNVVNETLRPEDGEPYEATFVTVRDTRNPRLKTILAVGLLHAYEKEGS